MHRTFRRNPATALTALIALATLPAMAVQADTASPPIPGPYMLATPAMPSPSAGGFMPPPGSMRVPYWLQQPAAQPPAAASGNASRTAARSRPLGSPARRTAPQGWPFAVQGYAAPGYGYGFGPQGFWGPGYGPQGFVPQGFVVPGWGPQPGWGMPAWPQQGQGSGQ